jgi:hypothetical protein
MEVRISRCWRAAGAALCAGAAFGCFSGEFLAYAPCATSESCADAGLTACVRLPDAEVRGFCTLECDADAACPAGQDGDASPRCATIAGADVCVLACAGDGMACPEGHVCMDVAGVTAGAGAPAAICFPAEAPE